MGCSEGIRAEIMRSVQVQYYGCKVRGFRGLLVERAAVWSVWPRPVRILDTVRAHRLAGCRA